LTTVILPRKNQKDLVDVPKKARNDLKIVFVEHMDQVLEVALLPPKPKAPRPVRASRKKKEVAPSEKKDETSIEEAVSPRSD
jgi:ATP-dependent Lon protease